MTITKERKKEIVKNLRENLAKQNGVFFINFKGMKGEDARFLRSKLKKESSNVVIARKTLAKIAFEKEKIDFDPKSLESEVGFVFSFEDALTTAKVINEFVKEEAITIYGGIFEDNLLTAQEVVYLANLPSKEEITAKFLSTISAPLRDFLQVLQGNTKSLLYILANKKE